MQTRSLETLVRVFQVQSFSRAAEMQNMTLSALSMQMRGLEQDLNAKLFDRSFRPPRLTPLGRSVALQAEKLLEEQARLQALCGPRDRLAGIFRLGFTQSTSVRILPRVLALLKNVAPDARVQVSTGLSETLADQVKNGALDAALITGTDDLEPLVADVVTSEPMAFAVPVAHSRTWPEDLPKHLSFIHFLPSTGIGKLIANSLETLPIEPRDVLTLDSIETCAACVRAGLGFTILPLPDLERYSDDGITILSEKVGGMTRDLALVTRGDTLSDRWRSALLTLVQEAVL